MQIIDAAFATLEFPTTDDLILADCQCISIIKPLPTYFYNKAITNVFTLHMP